MSAPRSQPSERSLLVVRAEAEPGMGHGHVARTFALAEEWAARGGGVALAAGSVPPEWRSRFEQLNDGGAPADDEPSWGVLDGYQYGERDQLELRARCSRLLVVDDHGTIGRYRADVVLDQNLGASADDYVDREPTTELLLGPQFALLRRDIRALAASPLDEMEPRDSVVLALGGDPAPRVRAVAEGLERALRERQINTIGLDGSQDAAAAFATAAVAVAAAGSVVWELCAAGVPQLLFSVAPNQVPIRRALAERGVAIDAGAVEEIDIDALAGEVAALLDDQGRRADMARRGRSVVDGRGVTRVIDAMLALGSGSR